MFRLPPSGRRLPALAAALLLTLLLTTAVQADEPSTYLGEWSSAPPSVDYRDAVADPHHRSLLAWWEKEALVAQPAETCDSVEFTDVPADEVFLVATDADLLDESDGSRLCLFYDARWNSYSAWTLTARTLDEFRATKRQLQPLLEGADIDACDVAFWTSLDQRLRRQIELPDRYDAGQPCPVEIVAHGPTAERRTREVEDALSASAAAADRLFDWELTWPIRVHLYDTFDAFVDGVREEGGDESASRDGLEFVSGMTGGPMASGGFGQLINLEDMEDAGDLRRVLAHEFAHIAQAGVIGDPDRLPFFVVEGGAEYVASLVVGQDNPGLALRFRDATIAERLNVAVPLREIVQPPRADDRERSLASYSRGYAAMRYLVAEWGQDAFVRLHRENIGGTPEQFIEAMTRLTGKSLDGFDTELRRYLVAEAAKPATFGRVSFPANSRLVDMTTAYVTSDQRLQITDRFTRSQLAARILFLWECLPTAVRGEARVIAPDGRRFADFGGNSGPGCGDVNFINLPLDVPVAGRVPRAMPGTWTIEIHADGALQGSITFIVE